MADLMSQAARDGAPELHAEEESAPRLPFVPPTVEEVGRLAEMTLVGSIGGEF